MGPLRILIVLNLQWDSRLGAVRVYAELSEQWRAAGHVVEKFTMSDAFPNAGPSPAGFALRQALFARKAAAFVRKNGGHFDIIDAAIGSLHGSKHDLCFNGLLVARSVGLYRLYERFEQSAMRRWPERSRGTWFGRIFYTMIRRRLMRASDQAVVEADIVNVPNEEEAECLRADFGSDRPIMIQPYGLTDERRKTLLAAAAPSALRLAHRKIAFIGMWSPRKGAHDWPTIVRRVWQRMPEARFCFLGTMVEPERVLADLGIPASERIELVSKYSPGDLPPLLSDCAVGAFPSYVEGFGLAVLEQLAAGIPTVAFDVPGPRDIVRPHLPEMLVPCGDGETMADAICKILELDPPQYEHLRQRSITAAASLDWSEIARDTLDAYRGGIARCRGKVLFVQPFSLGSGGGGGARILRALLQHAPISWRSVCCSPLRPKSYPNEKHLPTRPAWGKIEMSRLASLPRMTMPLFARRFRRRLKSFCQRSGVSAIHTVPHSGLDFAHAHIVARELSLPFFISLHDDLAYTAALRASVREPAMRAAWLDADARFVISEALGKEYSRRYGARQYEIVTDGLDAVPARRRPSASNDLRIYFMGLFHLGYEPNLRAFLHALLAYERDHPETTVTMRCRCEHIRPHVWKDLKRIEILPFADEAQIERDMRDADFLYMPMPFGPAHENFTRFSVSTKMVTYVGSGIPIIYHGPPTSAAFELLKRNGAAFFLTNLDAVEIAASLNKMTESARDEVVANALKLARHEFMLVDQTRKFWGTISQHVSPA